MGGRISMRLIVGVDNFEGVNDKRFEVPLDLDVFYEATFAIDKSVPALRYVQWKSGSNVDAWDIFNLPTDDYGAANLFGVTVAKLPYGDNCLYALASIDERFQSDGYVEVGKYTEDKYRAKPSKLSIDQFYKSLDWNFVVWLDFAQYFFDKVLFRVDSADLRLFLEWHWS